MSEEKLNTDTMINGFSRKIGRTHFLVNFVFKEDSTDGIKEKTKKLIWAEATGKELLTSNCMQLNQVLS